jgi:hypothetical protein
MTDDARIMLLEEVLYYFTRYRSAMAKGTMSESQLEQLSLLADDALDNRVAALEWAIQKTDLDFDAITPGLPKGPTLVEWLEIGLRDIRSLRAKRTK